MLIKRKYRIVIKYSCIAMDWSNAMRLWIAFTVLLVTTPVYAQSLGSLGSAAGGISVMGGGLTFGSTKVDEGCTIRLLARQLYAFGFQKAAVALMCQDEHVAAAMFATGSPCPRTLVDVSDRNIFSALPAQGYETRRNGIDSVVSVLPAQEYETRKNGID